MLIWDLICFPFRSLYFWLDFIVSLYRITRMNRKFSYYVDEL